MKSILLILSVLTVSLELGHAVAITLGQTAGAARFFATPGVPLPNTATLSMGWMSNPLDAATFIEFANTVTHGNTVFTTGVGTLAGNSVSPSLEAARNQSVFIRVISPTSGGGIWRSSTNYPADLTAAGTTPGAASLSLDTWTVVTPGLNWTYFPAGYQENTAALGLSDASAQPTARTGDAFILGAAIPEAGSATLGLLAVGLLSTRRRR